MENSMSSASQNQETRASQLQPAASMASIANFLATIKLDEDNFKAWKQQALACVKANKLQSHITALSIPRRFNSDKDKIVGKVSPDECLVAWMLSAMNKPFVNKVVEFGYAHEIWEVLEEYFAARQKSKIRMLKVQLKMIKKQGASAIEYISKINKVANSLSALGAPLSNEEHIEAALQGLGEDFSAFITMVNSKIDHMTESSTSRAGNESSLEESYQIYNNYSRGQSSIRSRGRGFRGGRSGWQGNRPQCQLCDRVGHTVWECFHRSNQNYQNPQLQSFNTGPAPPNLGFHQQAQHSNNTNQNPPQALLATNTCADQGWYPDSGASHHITFDQMNLINSSEYISPEQVFGGNGKGMSIANIGRSIMHASMSKTFFNLQNLLHETKKTLLQGRLSNGLYKFDDIQIPRPLWNCNKAQLLDVEQKKSLGQSATIDSKAGSIDSTARNSCVISHTKTVSNKHNAIDNVYKVDHFATTDSCCAISNSCSTLYDPCCATDDSCNNFQTTAVAPSSSVQPSSAALPTTIPQLSNTASSEPTEHLRSAETIVTSPNIQPSNAALPAAPQNRHPMMTRSKCGVFKPKAFSAKINTDPGSAYSTPSSVAEAVATPDWKKAMEEEYSALIKNCTWQLVDPPSAIKSYWLHMGLQGEEEH
ncbi:uncharacterized protein [Arachis hypogaea]|uniref:uncharacterized protein n=1 Tax=Arachis hypogaea TaxID=3818 RepID=UPI003B2112DA